MKAKIAEKREVAKGTLYVVFDLLGHEVDFKPGQYFWVTLLDPPYDDEKGPKRHISVATSPNDREVLALCTRLRDSAFKRSLAELPVGTEVEVEGPKGSFADQTRFPTTSPINPTSEPRSDPAKRLNNTARHPRNAPIAARNFKSPRPIASRGIWSSRATPEISVT